MKSLLEKYIRPMLEERIDCLVLGCTHYPFLIPQIKKITGTSVEIIDSGLAVARQTKSILQSKNLLNTSLLPSNHNIYSNKELESIKSLLKGSLENTKLHLEKY